MIDFNKKTDQVKPPTTLKTTTHAVTSININYLKSIGWKVLNNGEHIRIKHKRLF